MVAGWRTTRASSAMIRSGEASSGLMSISAIRGCSATSSLNRTRSAASASLSTGSPSAHAVERPGDLRLLDEVSGEGHVERRQRERAVLEHLDQLAAHPEQEDRPELRIGRGPTISS